MLEFSIEQLLAARKYELNTLTEEVPNFLKGRTLDRDIAELLRAAIFLKQLKHVLGDCRDASDRTVRICQDDATNTWHVRAMSGQREVNNSWGSDLLEAMQKAYEANT